MHVIEKQHAFVPAIFLKKQFITTKVYYTTRNEPVQSQLTHNSLLFSNRNDCENKYMNKNIGTT
jgi:hypothetical protein